MSVDYKKPESTAGWISDTAKIVIQALAIALVLRTLFFQPFNIPSGSMKETLLVGDYLFVSKLTYGYSRYTFPYGLNLFSGRILSAPPKRGDVVVFKLPRDPSIDYIKRVMGLPGDEIELIKGIVYINGKPLERKRIGQFTTFEGGAPTTIPEYEETLPEGKVIKILKTAHGDLDDKGPFKVPAGHYFMMGDNRDNSSDSRVSPNVQNGVGYVPFENLVGRAEIIFFSGAFDEPNAFKLWAPWTWPFDVRWRRFFKLVY